VSPQQRNSALVKAARLVARLRVERRRATTSAQVELLGAAVEHALLAVEALEYQRDDEVHGHLAEADAAWAAAQRVALEEPRVVIEGVGECTLAAFLADNGDGLNEEAHEMISRLAVGETYHGGGGAAAEWQVRRTA